MGCGGRLESSWRGRFQSFFLSKMAPSLGEGEQTSRVPFRQACFFPAAGASVWGYKSPVQTCKCSKPQLLYFHVAGRRAGCIQRWWQNTLWMWKVSREARLVYRLSCNTKDWKQFSILKSVFEIIPSRLTWLNEFKEHFWRICSTWYKEGFF